MKTLLHTYLFNQWRYLSSPCLQVYFDYMHSWIQMLQQLPQASHSLKNLLEEEWNFTKVITPYIRGGEAQSGKLFWLVFD